jgi:hypothetical protein
MASSLAFEIDTSGHFPIVTRLGLSLTFLTTENKLFQLKSLST